MGSAVTIKDVISAFPGHFKKNPKTAVGLARHWVEVTAKLKPVTAVIVKGRAVNYYPSNTIKKVGKLLVKAGKL